MTSWYSKIASKCFSVLAAGITGYEIGHGTKETIVVKEYNQQPLEIKTTKTDYDIKFTCEIVILVILCCTIIATTKTIIKCIVKNKIKSRNQIELQSVQTEPTTQLRPIPQQRV